MSAPLDSPFTELDPANRPLTRLDRFARTTAKISLIVGIIILLIFALSDRMELALIGYVYLAIAGIFNAVVMLIVISSMISYPERRRHHWETIGRMALNIPAAAVCTALGLYLM